MSEQSNIEKEVEQARSRWLEGGRYDALLSPEEIEMTRQRDMDLARHDSEAIVINSLRLSKGRVALTAADIAQVEALNDEYLTTFNRGKNK